MRMIVYLMILIASTSTYAKRDQLGNFITDSSCRNARYESEIVGCMTLEFNHYEKQNNLYASGIMKILSEADVELFKKAQVAWQESTDKNCAFLHKFDNSKIKRVMEVSCKILKSKKRRNELKTLFSKLGGKFEE